MRLDAAAFCAFCSLLAIGACGGSTSDGAGGTTGAGGTSGATGTGGCGSYAGDCFWTCSGVTTQPSCIDGHWVCPPSEPCSDGGGGCAGGFGIDCIDECTGAFYSPTCVNGNWECGLSSPCFDAGVSCASDKVPTAEGCLDCAEATTAYTTAIEAARTASAGCGSVSDCVLFSIATKCAGACPVAVSQSGASAFAVALAQIDADYCSGFADVCGYAQPKCAVSNLECNAGLCQTTFP